MEGPAPWERLSEEELEDQYSPSRWVIRRGAEEALRTYSHIGDEATKKARATRKSLLHVPYGDGEGEKLDIYFPEGVSEASPFCLFFHGGYWQSGRYPGPDGRPSDSEHRVCPEAVSMQRILRQGGWNASFEEIHDMDHFEIIWNLTQKDYVLTQMILRTILQEPRRH
ncbi:kynurenine formamidase isoform X6 [Vulpes vulpes]|uniref:Kynurenine formamidase isoform X6 n=1 Tax=Vulpes vulpes TaxID=9627 RepID=A0ABM4ZJC6_VULVU